MLQKTLWGFQYTRIFFQPERVAEEEKADVFFGLMTLNFSLARSIQSLKKKLNIYFS